MHDRTPGDCTRACRGATVQLLPRFLSVETSKPATGRPSSLPARCHSQHTNCPQPAAYPGLRGCYGLS